MVWTDVHGTYDENVAPFDRVVLIFNPNSTGQAQERAEDCVGTLGSGGPL